ncbi:MAG TPA: hypothetical protein VGL99_24530 [Chloroflexota bacterium]
MTTSMHAPDDTSARAPRGIRRTITSWVARVALAGAVLASGVADFPPGPGGTDLLPGPSVALAAIGPEYSTAIGPEFLTVVGPEV